MGYRVRCQRSGTVRIDAEKNGLVNAKYLECREGAALSASQGWLWFPCFVHAHERRRAMRLVIEVQVWSKLQDVSRILRPKIPRRSS